MEEGERERCNELNLVREVLDGGKGQRTHRNHESKVAGGRPRREAVRIGIWNRNIMIFRRG
jgi:hypothetical protein